MWIYDQRSGLMYNEKFDCQFKGYAGTGQGLNNPEMDHVKEIGPIPRGKYKIGPPKDGGTRFGPHMMFLTPRASNVMKGRSGFLIHSDRKDAKTNPFKASSGCIILSYPARVAISYSGDTVLEVV